MSTLKDSVSELAEEGMELRHIMEQLVLKQKLIRDEELADEE